MEELFKENEFEHILKYYGEHTEERDWLLLGKQMFKDESFFNGVIDYLMQQNDERVSFLFLKNIFEYARKVKIDNKTVSQVNCCVMLNNMCSKFIQSEQFKNNKYFVNVYICNLMMLCLVSGNAKNNGNMYREMLTSEILGKNGLDLLNGDVEIVLKNFSEKGLFLFQYGVLLEKKQDFEKALKMYEESGDVQKQNEIRELLNMKNNEFQITY